MIRYEGPKGSPGMPEAGKQSGALLGRGSLNGIQMCMCVWRNREMQPRRQTWCTRTCTHTHTGFPHVTAMYQGIVARNLKVLDC